MPAWRQLSLRPWLFSMAAAASCSGSPSFAWCEKAGGTGLAGGKRSSFDGFGTSPRPECESGN